MKSPIKQILTLSAVGFLLTACNSTKVVEAYKTENFNNEFDKIYVLGGNEEGIPDELIAEEIVDRFHERGVEANTTQMGTGNCICETAEQIEEFASNLSEMDYDAILTFTQLSKEFERDYTNTGSFDTQPGPINYPYYNDYYSYMGTYRPLVFSKGYVESKEVYNLEASLFSLEDGELVWVGKTETEEPLNDENFAKGYAHTIVDKLMYENVVQ
jgi:hypothetical protein